MSSEIHLELLSEESSGSGHAHGTAALAEDPDAECTLRLAIRTPDARGLEALRHARRSMLREEWTIGREPDEPSLESAVFSAAEVRWTVPAGERDRCRDRLRALETRANRALRELSRS